MVSKMKIIYGYNSQETAYIESFEGTELKYSSWVETIKRLFRKSVKIFCKQRYSPESLEWGPIIKSKPYKDINMGITENGNISYEGLE